VHYIRNKKL